MTPIEELLRSTLHDPARALTPAPGSVDAAVARLASLRRRRLATTVLAGAAAIAVVAGITVAGPFDFDRQNTSAGGTKPPSPSAREAEILKRISLPGPANYGLFLDSEAVFAVTGNTLVRVDRPSGKVVRQRTLPGQFEGLAFGPADTLWVSTFGDAPSARSLLQLDRRTLAVRRTLPRVDPT